MLCGCGKVPKLSNGEEAVVQFKDGGISANDFYNEIKDKYGLQTLINMIDRYIFEKEFASEIENAKNQAEAQVKSLRTNYDSDEEMEQALQSYGYGTVEAYKDYVYLSYLQNHAIETYVQGLVTEDELKKYYETDIYPNMNISHILITSNASSTATSDEKKKAEEEAKKKAEEVIKKLKESKDVAKTFEELAKEYSKDDSTKDKAGDLGEINIGSLDSKYDELVKAAAKLKDGEFSTSVIKTQAGFHVILKTKTGEKKSFDDVKETMKEAIAEDKLTENSSLISEAIQNYRKKYDLDIVDSEMQSQYSKYMNNLINNLKNQSSSN